jgi:hypothetical protein
MPNYALVRIADGTILREESDIDPTVGTKAGLAWLPIEESTTGSGPVIVGTVTTVLADKVTRVTTYRDKTAQEIDAEKASAVSSDLGATPAGRAMKQAFEGLFYLAKLSNPSMTLAQFKAGIENLNAIPDQAFFDWIKGKL